MSVSIEQLKCSSAVICVQQTWNKIVYKFPWKTPRIANASPTGGWNRCDWVKWIKIETKIKSRKSRRKGIPLKHGTPEALNDNRCPESSPQPQSPLAIEYKQTPSSASDNYNGNGEPQLNSSRSLKLLLQVLNSMSSPPAMPIYNRYPALNGYPQINGVDPGEPIDCRKLQSHRRYVQRGFHRKKVKARNRYQYHN